jgi:DNA-binding XRE family transcriptional regulator
MRISDLERLRWLRSALASGEARDLRVRHRLSQAEIAAVIHVGQPTVSLWESGKVTPRTAAALRYARLLRRLQENQAAERSTA